MKTYPLRSFVQRVLVVRLVLAAAVIAVVVGLLTYGVQRVQLERDVADLGWRGVLTLIENVRLVREQKQTDTIAALREVLEHSDLPVTYRAGRFVFIQVYDRTPAIVAEKAVNDQQDMDGVRAFVASRPFSFPKPRNEEVLMTNLDGASFVFIAAEIPGRSGEVSAFARAMFAISRDELTSMRKAMVRNTLIAIAIVMAVSALLYPVILQLTRRLADYSTHLLDANLETLSVLGSAIAKRDSDTDAHNYRVTLYSASVGEALGLTAAEMRVLIKGSFLHDVGKLGIPDNILLKPGRLDPEEFSVMKTHVVKGADIVRRSSWLRDGGEVVGYHHEKFAGGGYPHGLKGEEIPMMARIFAVSDVFDALTSRRPYKKPFTFEEAMNILEKERGRHFDPTVLDAFGKLARALFDRYAGHEGADLQEELAAVVSKYFSAGMEVLQYGERS